MASFLSIEVFEMEKYPIITPRPIDKSMLPPSISPNFVDVKYSVLFFVSPKKVLVLFSQIAFYEQQLLTSKKHLKPNLSLS